MIDAGLLEILGQISPEETAVLQGRGLQKGLYMDMDAPENIIDAKNCWISAD